MNIVEYKFHALCHENDKNYIFQFVKDRELTGNYHSHDFYEFVCFLRGTGTQIVNDEYILMEEKTVILLRPGDRHCFAEQSDDIEVISLSVRREEFERLSNVYEMSFEQCPVTFVFPRIFQLYDIYNENRSMSDTDCKLFLSTLLHGYAHTRSELSAVNIPQALLLAVDEMKKTENLKKGISAFVTLSNYSHSHLARLVKKHFHMGLKQYINELRLLRAYDDIIWTNESAEEISMALGFSSYSHFYKIFTKRFSVSPSSLRKGSKNKSIDTAAP